MAVANSVYLKLLCNPVLVFFLLFLDDEEQSDSVEWRFDMERERDLANFSIGFV